MTALALALLLQAAAPAAAAPPVKVTSATPAAPASPAAAVSPPAAEPDPERPTAEGLEDLRHSYHDSCELRLYGEYDDMCSAMADQIRRYRAELAKAERRRARP